MTSPDSPSPRTVPSTPLSPDEEAALRAKWSEFLDVIDPMYHPTGVVPRLLATLDQVRAAQEAPAPEGLREARDKRTAALTALLDAALAAAAPSLTAPHVHSWVDGDCIVWGHEAAPEGLRERLLALLGPSHPHDEGRPCGTCAAYRLLSAPPSPAEPPLHDVHGGGGHDAGTWDECHLCNAAYYAWRAEARPPEGLPSLDLAADIRAVDGNHDLGAGELAERLVARGWARPPEGRDTAFERLLVAVNNFFIVSYRYAHGTGGGATDEKMDATTTAMLDAYQAAARLSARGAPE